MTCDIEDVEAPSAAAAQAKIEADLKADENEEWQEWDESPEDEGFPEVELVKGSTERLSGNDFAVIEGLRPLAPVRI